MRVVILRGWAAEVDDDALSEQLIAAFKQKYGEEMMPDSVSELNGSFWMVRPRSVIAWFDFPADVTQWRLPP